MAEDNSSSTSPKCTRFSPHSSSAANSTSKKGMKNGGYSQPLKLKTENRGHVKGQVIVKKLQEQVAIEDKHRFPVAQLLPLTTDKPQVPPKPPVREQTKPLDIKLHTQERAVRRAGYNDLVASKMYSLEMLKKFEEKIQKVIDEEEIKMMRREMVPKAQLMPVFDRPFLPLRSTRPLTVPKEPRVLSRNCLNGNMDPYRSFQLSLLRNIKAIK